MSEKCPIIAIDPGNRQSAYCVIDCNTLKPLEFGKVDNEELRNKLVLPMNRAGSGRSLNGGFLRHGRGQGSF